MKKMKQLIGNFVLFAIVSLNACHKEISDDASAGRAVNTSASAQVTKSVVDIDVSLLGPTFVPIFCIEGGVGELLLMKGTLQLSSLVTTNGNHFTSLLQFHPHGITAVGQTTGDIYQSAGGEQITTTGSFINGQYTTSVIDRFYWIGRGGEAAKFKFNITSRVTINANGTVTCFIDKIEATCK
jgi:hypothetical protein